jgi:xanthine dehydrogenase large subunit
MITAAGARDAGTIVGRAVPHESARGHVTGEALYTDDLAGRFPNLLHAWPVLAPHAHAMLTRLDLTGALAVPGVVTVLTAGDVPGEGDSGANRHDEPLFPREIMFHRQPVAWVLADSVEAGRRAAAHVSAEYEPLPAVLTIEQAIATGSFLSEPFSLSSGDASVLARSAVQFAGELSIGGQEHFYLETQASIAWIDESGAVAVHSSTQHPAETQEIVARVLGLPRHQVTVECLRMGGAFGGKEVQANPWAAVAALGAWKTKRPVRVRLTRDLDMALTGKRHPYLARYAAGFSDDGRIEAVRMELFSDGGWSLDLSEPIMWRSLFHCDNAYRLPAVHVTGRVCRTHKTSQTAFRGFGGPQAMVVIEEIMALAAERLHLPADLVRERNLYRQGDVTHYGEAVDGAERLGVVWTELKRTSAFDTRRDAIARFNGSSPHVKRGLAITPVKFGISFTATFFNQGGALVLVYRDGTVQVNHGGTEMGQGLFTKIHQVATAMLGVVPEAVRVMPTRTDKVPNTSATAASSGTDLNGAAVADACAQLMARLRSVAASVLACPAEEVRFADSLVSGGGRQVGFAAVCDAAYHLRIPLFAQGYYRTPDIHFDATAGRGKPFHYYAFGAAVSEVEVDGFTGAYRLLRADILEDVGDSISPVVDRGQVEGGFIQGVGWLTLEELRWDDNGRLMTGGASTYKLPSWSEVPGIFNVDFLPRAAQPGVIFGSKAVGEPPLMLAISVREALRDAVAAFAEPPAHGSVSAAEIPESRNPNPGISFDSPATPERIFFAIRAARHRASGI